MKFVIALLALSLAGCASTVQKNAATFLQNLPNINAADVSQTTTTPVFSHSESVANLVTSAGVASVSNVKASLSITPGGIPVYTNVFTASSVSVAKSK